MNPTLDNTYVAIGLRYVAFNYPRFSDTLILSPESNLVLIELENKRY